jgi:hypothetical protein
MTIGAAPPALLTPNRDILRLQQLLAYTTNLR